MPQTTKSLKKAPKGHTGALYQLLIKSKRIRRDQNPNSYLF